MSYTPLNDLPLDLPPAYEPSPQLQFDLEDPINQEPLTFRQHASNAAKSFNKRIIQPINNALDPIYQLYCYSNAKFEYYISKVGNPLIIKRFMYIFFFAIILYIATLTGLSSEGMVGLHSDFTDPLKLSNFIEMSLDPKRLEENLQYFSSMPHLSGTSGDLALGEYIENFLSKSRLELNPDVIFEAFTNYPKKPTAQLFKNDELLLDLQLFENVDDQYNLNNFKYAFNPGSPNLKATGPLVYVNYGSDLDYNFIKQYENPIVIIKYSPYLPAFRQIQMAEKHGAAGVLFISDPQLQSIYSIDSIQREPVAFTNKYPGNILNPGIISGSILDRHFDVDKKLRNSDVMPSIPSIPISWKDFKLIMKHLQGIGERVQDWDFKLYDEEIEIWLGSPDFKMSINPDLIERPFKESWNIIGKLEGSEQDTFAIVIGSSRDSVCFGGMESSSSAILMELMNIFSEMSLSLPWRPLRSIYFASFTGSKYNIAGSTNFVIKNNQFTQRDVYAYIDLDDLIQGDELEFSVDPLFKQLVINSINEMKNSNLTALPEIKMNNIENDDLINHKYIFNPISNSLPFQQRYNVPGISVKLINNDNDKFKDNNYNKWNVPKYPKNSCLDTFNNFKENLIDPDMSKHSFITKLIANIIVKLSDTPILPYDIFQMIKEFKINLEEIKSSSNGLSNIDFSKVENLINKITFIAEQNEAFTITWNDICDNGKGTEPNLLSVNRWDWNSKLLLLMKVLIQFNGTYNDPWNRNFLYGLYDGEYYDHFELPGLSLARNSLDFDGLQNQLNEMESLLEGCISLFQY